MDGLSAAGGILAIAAAGLQTSVKLISFAHHVGNAPERIRYIATDVSLTASILQQLGELMKQSPGEDERANVFSEGGLVSTQTSANTCREIFKALEEALKQASQQIRTSRIVAGEKVVLSRVETLKWPFLQPKFDVLRTELSNARATLMLILQVASLAYTRKMAQFKNPIPTYQGEQDDLINTIIALQRLQTGEVSDQEDRPHCRIDSRSRKTPPTARGPSAKTPAELSSPFTSLRTTSRMEDGNKSLRRKYLDGDPRIASDEPDGHPSKRILTQKLRDKGSQVKSDDRIEHQDNIPRQLEATYNTSNSTRWRSRSTRPDSRTFFQAWDMTPVIMPMYCGWKSTWQIQTSPISNQEFRKLMLFKLKARPESLDWKEREFLTESFQRQSAENDHIEYGPDQTVRIVLVALQAQEERTPGLPEKTIQRRHLKAIVRVEQQTINPCGSQASMLDPDPHNMSMAQVCASWPGHSRGRASTNLCPSQISVRKTEQYLQMMKPQAQCFVEKSSRASQEQDTTTTEETKRPFFSEENLRIVDELLAKYTTAK
ncbi:MAG: hypothetical protein Q9220_006033 [cf. Caloplaca sp. 1 TL-2023]